MLYPKQDTGRREWGRKMDEKMYLEKETGRRKREKSEIQVISHPLSKSNKHGKLCKVCGKGLLAPDVIYGSEMCDHFLCESCSEIPQQMEHFLLRLHSLLLVQNSSLECSACWEFGCSNMFQCKDCEFNLDLRCAASKFAEKFDNPRETLHPHPLMHCDRPTGNSHCSCYCCHKDIGNDRLYVYLQCKYFLHES